MNFENLQPVAVDHAVQSVHFVIEWNGALNADSVVALGKLQTKFRNLGYGHMLPQNRLEFKFEAGGSSQGSQGLIGYMFTERPQPDTGRQVSVNAENCTIMFPDYTRWDSVFASIQEILKVVLEEVGTHRAIRTIGLQYNDGFLWNDDPAELDLREVFNNDFVIPPHVFDQTGLWHLHHGYFEKIQEPVLHTVLQNINVDMLDTQGGRVLQILGSHKANLEQPLWQSHKKNQPLFFSMITHLHDLNKKMLRSLLTNKVCQRIKLVP
ncbi:TIGR04255 family protein [Massilia sp. CMS3.1]|uniref:TIGR04255 family protein n=1 Tax=Massilia sp. CMS3.1 TaxID=3373083 RepID=UPI003EE5C189